MSEPVGFDVHFARLSQLFELRRVFDRIYQQYHRPASATSEQEQDRLWYQAELLLGLTTPLQAAPADHPNRDAYDAELLLARLGLAREVQCGGCNSPLSLYWWGKACPYCHKKEPTP